VESEQQFELDCSSGAKSPCQRTESAPQAALTGNM